MKFVMRNIVTLVHNAFVYIRYCYLLILMFIYCNKMLSESSSNQSCCYRIVYEYRSAMKLMIETPHDLRVVRDRSCKPGHVICCN